MKGRSRSAPGGITEAISDRGRPAHFGRRGFLAVLGAGVLAACSGGPPPGPPATSAPAPARRTTTGLPDRQIYLGAAVPAGRLDAFEATLGRPLACYRSFFNPGGEAKLVAQATADLAKGTVPIPSIKPPGSWAETARNTAWIDSVVTPLAALPGPVFLVVHHEPENDAAEFGTAADFVAMQRAVIDRAGQAGPNVTVVPVLLGWSTGGNLEPDMAQWNVDAAAVYGVDIYNPWAPGKKKDWIPFSDRLGQVTGQAAGRPMLIGEFGCRTDPATPGRAAAWMQDAFDSALAAKVAAMAYFDSDHNSRDGTWELDGERLTAYMKLLAGPDAARLSG